MDTLTFLSMLVPEHGTKFAVEIRKTKGIKGKKADTTIHFAVDTVEELTGKVLELDRKAQFSNAKGNPTKNIYFALATYKQAVYETKTWTDPQGESHEFVVTKGRTQDNALLVKSLWQDFDVGKGDVSISYATREEAVASLKVYLKETGMPLPLLVNSGYGFHAYWPFAEAVTAAEWDTVASLQRNIFRHLGVKFDSSRDKDCSSILRPLQCHNCKPGAEDKQVRLVRPDAIPTPRPMQFYLDTLTAYATKAGLVQKKAATAKKAGSLNADLLVENEYPPSYADLVADRCNQIKLFRETGCLSEITWHRAQGAIKACVDGEEKIHEYSSRYPDYDYDETQAKIDAWRAKPTTCTEFREINPEGCAGCNESCTNPIQLGVEQRNVEEELAKPYPFMPKNYDIASGGVVKFVRDQNGSKVPVRFASPAFYPLYWFAKDDGTWALRIRVENKAGVWSEFDLDNARVPKADSLKSNLAAYRINIYDAQLAMSYLNTYGAEIRQHAEDINCYKQFGWVRNFDGCLIGNQLINRVGEVTTVRLNESVPAELKDLFRVRGTAKEWVDGVDYLYNQPGAEMYQYAIGHQFGAVLTSILDNAEWNGIPLALTSDRSGYGKSTAVRIGINGLYDCERGTVTDSTKLAALARLSDMNHLPVLFDEVTHWLPDAEALSHVLYAASNGKGRERLTNSGKAAEVKPAFKGGSTFTGNRNMMFQLSESKTNPEALAMRVFEIDLMQDYPKLDTLKNMEDDGWEHPDHQKHRDTATHLISNVTGVLAIPYLTNVMAHRDAIRIQVYELNRRITKILGGRSAKERFYAYNIACSITALRILHKLGFIKYDVLNVFKWAINHVYKLRQKSDEMAMTNEDKFSMLLSDLHGRILVTKRYETLDARSGATELPILLLRESPVARLVLKSDVERGRLYVAVQAVDAWCKKNAINAGQFKAELAKTGFIRPAANGKLYQKTNMAKGVPTVVLGQARVIEFDYNKAQGYIDNFLDASNKVVALKRAVAESGDLGEDQEEQLAS